MIEKLDRYNILDFPEELQDKLNEVIEVLNQREKPSEGDGKCQVCDGSGEGDGWYSLKCPNCDGTGKISSKATLDTKEQFNATQLDGKCPECYKGKYVNGDTCRKCDGTGLLPQDECDDCNGTGKVERKRTLDDVTMEEWDKASKKVQSKEPNMYKDCKPLVASGIQLDVNPKEHIKFSPETYPPNKLPKEQTLESVIREWYMLNGATGTTYEFVDVIRGWMKGRIKKLPYNHRDILSKESVLKALDIE